jgi:hypothetical protein
MAGYKAPSKRLHREFLYLNEDSVLNSLSALEAGKVDEIIQKVSEAREGGLDASLSAGPVRGGGKRKKLASAEEELVKRRTRFSAFDAWYGYLSEEQAIGTFDVWGPDVRNALSVGDTVEFSADVLISPVHKVLRTFLSFAEQATRPGTTFSQKGQELAETKATAAVMRGWIGGADKRMHLPVYLLPGGVTEPRIVARLADQHLIGGHENVEGNFTVVGQVAALLSGDHVESAIRIIRDVPPTPTEVTTINEALLNFIEPAKDLGIEIAEDDITIREPAAILRPIAIFQ